MGMLPSFAGSVYSFSRRRDAMCVLTMYKLQPRADKPAKEESCKQQATAAKVSAPILLALLATPHALGKEFCENMTNL